MAGVPLNFRVTVFSPLSVVNVTVAEWTSYVVGLYVIDNSSPLESSVDDNVN